MNELETKQAKFFDGAMGDAEAKVLARELELNPEGVREFIGNYRVDRLLTVKFQPTSAEAIDAIMVQIRHENHPFVQSVLRDIRTLSPRTTFVQSIREWMARYRGVLQWTVASAAMVVLALLCVWLFVPSTGEPVIAEATGSVTLEHAGQTLQATVGGRFQPADVLRTGTNAGAIITFGVEHTRFELGELSELKLTSLSSGKRFTLRAGHLAATVAGQHLLRPMVMLTAQARATVVGTEFTLNATTNSTRLDVFDGVVRFAKLDDGQTVKVSGGSFAVATAATNLTLQPITGKVLREVWFDLPGDTLHDLMYSARYPGAPSAHDFPPSFHAETNWPSAFGTRTRSYLVPPASGNYEFYIDGVGQVGLWLSPDEDPVDKVKIAQIAFTRNRPGDPAPTETHSRQESGPVSLEAGRRYYIEVIHKYGDSQDRLTVNWKRPDGTLEAIPSEFLSPFKSQSVKKHR